MTKASPSQGHPAKKRLTPEELPGASGRNLDAFPELLAIDPASRPHGQQPKRGWLARFKLARRAELDEARVALNLVAEELRAEINLHSRKAEQMERELLERSESLERVQRINSEQLSRIEQLEALTRELKAGLNHLHDGLQTETSHRQKSESALEAFDQVLGEQGKHLAETVEGNRKLRSEIAGLRENLNDSPDLSQFVEAPGDGLPADLDAVLEASNGGTEGERRDIAIAHAFRGSEETIAQRQALYLERIPELVASSLPVVDVGAGRGEFLHLLRLRNVACVGLERNRVLAARLRSEGFDVYAGDALEYLEGRPDGSVGVITAFQVVEHFSEDYLNRFLKTAYAKLSAGGILLAETVNPYCLATYRTFHLDPTHVHPIPHHLLSLLVRFHGFDEVRVFFATPRPPNRASFDPSNAGQFYEDYAVVAKKR